MKDNKKLSILIIAGLAILIIGIAIGRLGPKPTSAAAPSTGEKTAEVWTCSMHPQIKQPEFGKCPICAMDLIPLKKVGEEGPREVTLSAAARQLAQVEVVPVRRQHVTRLVRLVGKVEYDETKVATIAAWVPGRLDRLYVDYTGISVKEGDHMVYLYSPEILTAQEELVQAVKAEASARKSNLPEIRQAALATVKAVREKLRLWGLGKDQIANLERSGQASDHITINAPIGGIVIHKNAEEGSYVKTGAAIYKIADLRQVWVKLDAYESDLPWLRYGQEVEFQSESYPGELFKGRISFIDPVLTSRSRTVKVRVNVPNEQGRLKPGMFVRATVAAVLGGRGRVVDQNLAGKWISPMHPEVIKDKAGSCDVCGMPLVPAEELGFVARDDANQEPPLVIPASAAMLTGKRAVVYVQQKDPSSFEGREVNLGPRADDFYVVEAGLKQGENVVVNGNFKIDSALQIVAKPSMMSPDGGGAGSGHQHHGTRQTAGHAPKTLRQHSAPAEFMKQIATVFDGYFQVGSALGNDKPKVAQERAGELVKLLTKVDMKLVSGKAHEDWMNLRDEIRNAAREVKLAPNVDKGRLHFKSLSIAMKRLAKSFGTGKTTVFVNTCSMAFDNTGAEWLQGDPELLNPYFGEIMPRCGELVEKLEKGVAKPKQQKHEGSHGKHEGSHHGH